MTITSFLISLIAAIAAFFGYSHSKKKQGKQEVHNDNNAQIAKEIREKQAIQFNNSRLSDVDRRERVQEYEKANEKLRD